MRDLWQPWADQSRETPFHEKSGAPLGCTRRDAALGVAAKTEQTQGRDGRFSFSDVTDGDGYTLSFAEHV
jgi:hypothetical protein